MSDDTPNMMMQRWVEDPALNATLTRWRTQAQAYREKAKTLPRSMSRVVLVAELNARADTLDACFNEIWSEMRIKIERKIAPSERSPDVVMRWLNRVCKDGKPWLCGMIAVDVDGVQWLAMHVDGMHVLEVQMLQDESAQQCDRRTRMAVDSAVQLHFQIEALVTSVGNAS